LVNVPDRSIFFRRGRARTDGKFIILYPGTLNWHQGVDIAIRALNLISREAPHAELHIYGEGPCQSSLARLVHELKLEEKVRMSGFIPTRDIAAIMEGADIGIVPKRRDGFGDEAFSTKIMEFMSLGVPVLVADTRVDRHYFNDSLVHFFHSGDEKDLAQELLLLIHSPELREELASNALEFVEHNDWDHMKSAYFSLVDGLVGKVPSQELARA
jgi:glycosyltransferase involved in cell wall biosynthesis